jgi:NitT/TauT family transport system substrate-binding protein
MKRSVFFLVRALLAAVLIGGIHGQAAAQQKLRVGLLPFSESLGAVMAERLGYFRDEGLEVEVSLFNSGALALPLLQAGKLDIAFSNTVATLQAMEQGLDAMLLAPGAVVGDHPPDSTTALLALKGTLATPKALEGKRIAVNVINSSAWLYLVAYLDKVGVEQQGAFCRDPVSTDEQPAARRAG